MFEPGYYKTSYRAQRLREMIRWYGWRRGAKTWLKNRFTNTFRAAGWMPGLWDGNECKPEDLSGDFWQATIPHRADFEKLGFVQCRLTKSQRLLDPTIRDSGGILYLDATRCYSGHLHYSQNYRGEKRAGPSYIVVVFTAAFENESFSCTNNRLTFDSVNAGKVIRMDSFDVIEIYNRFRGELQRRRDTPRPFADIEALRQWFDARQIKNFEDHVKRRLFVPMTESEVEVARAERERTGQIPPPPPHPWRKFRLEPWPTTLALILLIWLVMQRRHETINAGQNPSVANTIGYEGQQFKMSRPYTEYENYKDDPNNLDTNELPRIERAMEAVKIPESFSDRKAFIKFMFEFEFPGYGLGERGAQTDDGSTIELDSVEIPQAGKDRVIVVRKESDSELKLVDDFIFNHGETNYFGRVLLVHRQLEYFDRQGRLFRSKTLE
jgi:hypothetical protein